ncbi:MAG: hypothetical protein LBD21_04345 [Tannerellaceae bacterium]|jgi:hypothetical protein|nr:hypothetical protein [Tannerellaceae bacterium]
MLEEKTFVYVTYAIMVFAAFTLLWTYRKNIRKSFDERKAAATADSLSGYDIAMQNKEVRDARKWDIENHGQKREDRQYYEFGKNILASEIYNELKNKMKEEDYNI